jgi:uncharacterized membrane protein YedE/YeeE
MARSTTYAIGRVLKGTVGGLLALLIACIVASIAIGKWASHRNAGWDPVSAYDHYRTIKLYWLIAALIFAAGYALGARKSPRAPG